MDSDIRTIAITTIFAVCVACERNNLQMNKIPWIIWRRIRLILKQNEFLFRHNSLLFIFHFGIIVLLHQLQSFQYSARRFNGPFHNVNCISIATQQCVAYVAGIISCACTQFGTKICIYIKLQFTNMWNGNWTACRWRHNTLRRRLDTVTTATKSMPNQIRRRNN